MHTVRINFINIQAHAILYVTHHNCDNRIFKSVAKRTGSLSLLDKFISLRRSFATVNALSIISIFLWTDGTDSLDSSSTRVCGFIKVPTVWRRTVFPTNDCARRSIVFLWSRFQQYGISPSIYIWGYSKPLPSNMQCCLFCDQELVFPSSQVTFDTGI